MYKIYNSILFLACVFVISNVASAVQNNGNAMYVATNKDTENTIAAYYRMPNGKFRKLGEYGTGGIGTGDLEIPEMKKDSSHPLANGDDPLISAYGLLATEDRKHILVVNAGDASISSMRVNKDFTLTLLNKAKATDMFPVSIAVHSDKVIIASVGTDNSKGSIGAYMLDDDGWLHQVADSRRDLNARPSTVAFTEDGQHVVVSELVTGKIKVYESVNMTLSNEPIAVADSPRSESRFQAIPVGFDIAQSAYGQVIMMSEARFLTPDFKLREEANKVPQTPKYSWQTGSLSTYLFTQDSKLNLISSDVLTGSAIEGGEIANCWVVYSDQMQTLWAANALSSSISSFRIDSNGKAVLKNVTAFKDDSELLFFSDIEINDTSSQLFQLVGNKGQVMIFSIQDNGDLILDHTVNGMPELGTYGLVVL